MGVVAIGSLIFDVRGCDRDAARFGLWRFIEIIDAFNLSLEPVRRDTCRMAAVVVSLPWST